MSGSRKTPKDGTISVSLTVDPTSGNPDTKEVTVPMSGATLREVLKAAGIKTEGKDLFLNDKPAGLDDHVTDGQKVNARSKQPEVRVAERPRGS